MKKFYIVTMMCLAFVPNVSWAGFDEANIIRTRNAHIKTSLTHIMQLVPTPRLNLLQTRQEILDVISSYNRDPIRRENINHVYANQPVTNGTVLERAQFTLGQPQDRIATADNLERIEAVQNHIATETHENLAAENTRVIIKETTDLTPVSENDHFFVDQIFIRVWQLIQDYNAPNGDAERTRKDRELLTSSFIHVLASMWHSSDHTKYYGSCGCGYFTQMRHFLTILQGYYPNVNDDSEVDYLAFDIFFAPGTGNDDDDEA